MIAQDARPSVESNQDSTSIPFSEFLKTLPNSISNRINQLQHSLAKAQDKLDAKKAKLLSQTPKGQDIASSNQKLPTHKGIENMSYITSEVVALSRALLNLQSSSKLEFELAYIEENKELLFTELDKLINEEISEQMPQEQLKSTIKNQDDLASYTFETHQVTSSKEYPDFDCAIITDARSKDSKYTKLSPLFTYTPSQLEQHFQGSSYVECHAQLATADNLYFINLNINIRSNSAKDIYGGIEKGAAIRLELVNGEKILAYNVKRDFGTLSTSEDSVQYEVIYSIKKSDLKSLSKFDLDRIGIIWTSGYEDYDIYETDFILNHLNCLN